MSGKTLTYELISPEDLGAVERHLRELDWIGSNDVVHDVQRAGDGNMNCTLRVQLKSGTRIVKQARPWCEKFPHIPAPDERAVVEAAFYKYISSVESVSSRMPRLLASDSATRTLLLEDVGQTHDFSDIYQAEWSPIKALPDLCQWLFDLHSLNPSAEIRKQFKNRDMRILNCEHIFYFPLRAKNGLDLESITPGLSGLAQKMMENKDYVIASEMLGRRYMKDGNNLLHGDFFPGSWLYGIEEGHAWVIDPEFCFMGPAEFDLGIMMAHLLLAGSSLEYALNVFDFYSISEHFKPSLALGFSGVEIMRRLIGVSQLPLAADIERKSDLLELSRELVLTPKLIV